MITCKVCGSQEYHGTIFCSQCGSQLVRAEGEQIDTLVYPNQTQGMVMDLSNTIPKKYLQNKTFLLYDPQKEKVIDLPDQAEFTIGRIVEGQVITPDVDLNPYDAYDRGISRLHATMRVDEQKEKIFIVDLGSANGTRVNGYEIPANSEVPLNHGDVIRLGKFNLKVILPKELKG